MISIDEHNYVLDFRKLICLLNDRLIICRQLVTEHMIPVSALQMELRPAWIICEEDCRHRENIFFFCYCVNDLEAYYCFLRLLLT